MKVVSGMSSKKIAKEAVAEAVAQWNRNEKPSLILIFHSSSQNAQDIANEVFALYPDVLQCGCTTTGEHLDGKHYNDSLVMSALFTPEVKWSIKVIENLKTLDEKRARVVVDSLMTQLEIDRENISAEKQFCLTFIDGLSMKEENVSAIFAEALEGIPLLGGSAGDDLKFQKTWVMVNGKAYEDSAVLVLADSSVPFQVIKHQHFVKTPRQLVITRADGPARRVYEMDGRVAAVAYADALGLKRSEVTGDACFVNPLLFRVNNEIYIRSIQKIEDDGSIVFFCAMEEGIPKSLISITADPKLLFKNSWKAVNVGMKKTAVSGSSWLSAIRSSKTTVKPSRPKLQHERL